MKNKTLGEITKADCSELIKLYLPILKAFKDAQMETPADVLNEITIYGIEVVDNLTFLLRALRSMKNNARN